MWSNIVCSMHNIKFSKDITTFVSVSLQCLRPFELLSSSINRTNYNSQSKDKCPTHTHIYTYIYIYVGTEQK